MSEDNIDYVIPFVSRDTCNSLREYMRREYERGVPKDELFGELIEELKSERREVFNFLKGTVEDFENDNPEIDADFKTGYAEGLYDGIILLSKLLRKQLEANNLRKMFKHEK